MNTPEKNAGDGELPIAEYALGTLSLPERRAFEERLKDDPQLRRRLEEWEARLVPMAREYAPQRPDPGLLARIEERLFGAEKEMPAMAASLPRFWQWLSFASLAGMAFFAVLYFQSIREPSDSPARYVAELRSEADVVRLVAAYDPDSARLRINRTRGQAETGKDLELWLIPDGGAPISLGVLPEDRKFAYTVPSSISGQFGNGTLAISVEPAGGSPTGQPTGEVVASGILTEL